MRVHVCLVALLLLSPPGFAAAQSQTEGFSLLCTSSEPGVSELKLRVLIYENGAEITHVEVPPPNEYPLRAYANALTWSDGNAQYEADRMTGVLKVTPGGRAYICEKHGGKKF
jgi:hypothetical protein